MHMFNGFPVQECVAKRRHKFFVNYRPIASDIGLIFHVKTMLHVI